MYREDLAAALVAAVQVLRKEWEDELLSEQSIRQVAIVLRDFDQDVPFSGGYERAARDLIRALVKHA